ncbi:MAG: nucleotidyltransferase family protein [Clostridia bacterium]|nr:nucleotidyltransferase family protein [Clostridia bacterium]
MKIVTAVCEYNPFHNGHATHLNYINDTLKPDYTVVILSGNFTQRGEPSVVDKYTRAVWAIKAGADAVIELPTVFATSTAELFGSGAIKLINALPFNKEICFGAENDNVEGLINLAKFMLDETPEFKQILKGELDKGEPLLKARITALKETLGDKIDTSFLDSPNNILGLEYVKAILKNNYDIKINALRRLGSGYNDDKLNANLSSALAIRKAIENGTAIDGNIPSYVLNDLPTHLPNVDKEIYYSILTSSLLDIKSTLECAEGLENKIKTLSRECTNVEDILARLKTKRYTDARLRRILLATMLKISGNFIKECLNSDLYLKVLAINKNKPEILSVLSNSKYPIITRKSDAKNLTGTALKCFEKDVLASDIYTGATGKKLNEFDMKIV